MTNLDERVALLEARMGLVERKLGMRTPADPAVGQAPVAPAVPAPPPRGEPPQVAPKPANWLDTAKHMKQQAREPVVPPPPAQRPTVEKVEPPLAVSPPVARPAPLPPRVQPAIPYAQPAAAPPMKQTAFERTVGLKWAGWAGAIVMVIGVALGIKFAYEQGMFAVVPPTLRLVLMFLGGFGLIAAGEVVYRRVNKLSAVGLFGAGVASLFVVSYAGHGYYELYTRDVAFGLMAVATLVGAGVAMRGGLVSIAALSLVGGNVAPLVMGGFDERPAAFFAYLAALQVVALVLAAWGRDAKWWTLRALSLATTSLWMAAAIGWNYGTDAMQLAFCIGYGLPFQLELLWTNWTLRKADEAAEKADAIGLVFSLVVTASLALAGLAILDGQPAQTRAAWLAGLGAAMLLFRAVTARQTGALRQLSLGYSVQAAALATAAAPVALGGIALSFGWAGLAVAMAALGVVTGSKVARFFAPAVWAFAVAYLLAWTMDQSTLATRVVLGTSVYETGFVAMGLALVGYVVARLLTVRLPAADAPLFDSGAQLLAGAATLTFVTAAVAALPATAATLVLVAFAWALAVADRFARPLQLAVHGFALLTIATIKWATVDVITSLQPTGVTGVAYEPIFNPMMGTGLLVALSLAAVAFVWRKQLAETLKQWGATDAGERLLQVTAGVVVALVTLGLSVEIHRAVEAALAAGQTFARPAGQVKFLGLTMLWSAAVVVYRAVITLAARVQKRPVPVMEGLNYAILSLAAKYVVIDTLAVRLDDGRGRVASLVNAELLTALAVVAAAVAVRWLSPRDERQRDGTVAGWIAVAMTVVWAGTMQIDAFVATHSMAPWPALQASHILLTTWWTLCTGGFAAILLRRFRDEPRVTDRVLRVAHALAVVLASQYVLLNLALFGLAFRPAPALVAFNLQGLAATVIASLLVFLTIRMSRPDTRDRFTRARLTALLTIVALLLVWGTVEINRFFLTGGAVFAAPARARGVAVSIYWAAFAIAAVTAGFHWRTAALRYVGLGLFAVTLAKVFFVDLGEVGTGYRILSFFGLGLLLMGTSVLYGKLGPKLLAEEER